MTEVSRDPKIFLCRRGPFDLVARIISLTLPSNWQIGLEGFDSELAQPVKDEVINLIEQSTHLIVIWSRENRSNSLVNQEIGAALHKDVPIITLVQQGVPLEAMLDGIERTIYEPTNPVPGIIEFISKLDHKLVDGGYTPLDRKSAFTKLNRAWSTYQYLLEVRL